MMNFGYLPIGGLGWIFMLVFWCLVIWLFVAMIKGGFNQGHLCGRDHDHNGRAKEKSPLDILKERYAKGEINKKEFEDKKQDLI